MSPRNVPLKVTESIPSLKAYIGLPQSFPMLARLVQRDQSLTANPLPSGLVETQVGMACRRMTRNLASQTGILPSMMISRSKQA